MDETRRSRYAGCSEQRLRFYDLRMSPSMDLSEIRKLIVVGIASDDVLMERLVLKGGNALELIHKIGERASLDLDFSMEDDFEDLDETKRRLFRALRGRFDYAGFYLFDESFVPRPAVTSASGDFSRAGSSLGRL